MNVDEGDDAHPGAKEESESGAAAADTGDGNSSSAGAPSAAGSGDAAAGKGGARGEKPPATGANGPVLELPAPSLPFEEVRTRAVDAMRARSFTQSGLCRRLCLSPVYFSMWLREKALPAAVKAAYHAAVETWVADETFTVYVPSLTKTTASQVPGRTRPQRAGAAGGGGGPKPKTRSGDGPSAAASKVEAARRQERREMAVPTTPHALLTEMLNNAGGAPLARVRFQLQQPCQPAAADGGCVSVAEASAAAAAELVIVQVEAAPTGDALQISVAPEGEDCGGASAAGGGGQPEVIGWLDVDGTLREAGAAAGTRGAAVARPQRSRRVADGAAPPDLLRCLHTTIDEMANEPLRLRMQQRVALRFDRPHREDGGTEGAAAPDAADISATGGGGGGGGAEGAPAPSRDAGGGFGVLCSVCGARFRSVCGPLQLASHASLHLLHDQLQWRRTHRVQPAIGTLRAAGTLPELRQALDDARAISRELPDAGLQRAQLQAEARQRAMDKSRQANRSLPPTPPRPAAPAALPPVPVGVIKREPDEPPRGATGDGAGSNVPLAAGAAAARPISS